MKNYTVIKKSRYFNALGGLSRENMNDAKVAMSSEIDLTSAERVRQSIEESVGVKPSYTALVTKAVSLALREQPHANRVPVGPWFWTKVLQLNTIDVSVMVERDVPGDEQAAFAATIRDTDKKDLATLTRELRELANATPETSARWRQFKWIVENLPNKLAVWTLSVPRWSA